MPIDVSQLPDQPSRLDLSKLPDQPSPAASPEGGFQFVTPQAQDVAEARQIPAAVAQVAETKPAIAVADYIRQMIPTSGEELERAAGIPSDWTDPSQVAGLMFPMLRPGLQISEQANQRFQQIQQAEETPAWSQERWNAGIGTAADLAGLASILHGAIVSGEGIPSPAQPTVADAIRGLDVQPPSPEAPQAPPAQSEIITPELGSPFHPHEIPAEDLRYAEPAAAVEAPIGAANRVAAAREQAGLLGDGGAPPPGIGVGWQDSVNAGNAAIDAGTADPYKVLSDFQKNQLINGQRMGVARAWLERLQRANAEAQGAFERSPSDPVLAQKAQTAQDAENAYWQGYQPMKTEWSKVGTGMQETRGVTDTDLLSQKTAEQTMREHLDRELTEAEKARAAKAVNDTRQANGNVDQAFKKAYDSAARAAKGPKMTDAQLKQSLADTLKEVTC